MRHNPSLAWIPGDLAVRPCNYSVPKGKFAYLLAFDGFALGTPPGAPAREPNDNADRWLWVSLSNKAQFSTHLEVREF